MKDDFKSYIFTSVLKILVFYVVVHDLLKIHLSLLGYGFNYAVYLSLTLFSSILIYFLLLRFKVFTSRPNKKVSNIVFYLLSWGVFIIIFTVQYNYPLNQLLVPSALNTVGFFLINLIFEEPRRK